MTTTNRRPRRNTTRRDRYRRQLAIGNPPCALCGNQINYDANHLDPMSFTIDHIQPIAAGGRDVLDNLQPTHRSCNRTKSDKVEGSLEPTWQTWRSW
jgi:5-methylcytosine-specific restriction endonuclease McrA